MGNYIWPCPDYVRISSGYGNRTSPFGGTEFHWGVDLACASGKDILATRAGKVTISTYNGGYGNYIEIDHGAGIKSRYAHASRLLVGVNATVTAGQRIACVGTTGKSTGCHLHFEIRVNGAAKSPLDFVSAKDTVSAFGNTAAGNFPGGNATVPNQPQAVDITKVVEKSITGSPGKYKYTDLKSVQSVLNTGCELLIQNDKIYMPAVEGDISLAYERKGSPGTLTFNVMKDGVLNIDEGNPVRLRVNGKNVFYGYLFSKSRSDKTTISITAYDQIRYLKNKDTMVYSGITYSQLLKMVAAKYGLTCGTVADTKYVIPKRIEEAALLDILGNASDLTVLNTGKLFVLYDDFGKLILKNIESMMLPILIDADTAGEYKYTSSIDKDTYNRIKIASDNSETGTREVYVLNDAATQSKWGLLQYYENISNTTPEVIKEKSKALMKYYNKKQRTLSLNKCFGDTRVRGGSSVVVKMDLGDVKLQNYMVVEKVKHTFSAGQHLMDLIVSGVRGEFVV